jgi:ATP-dependent Zn protease
VRALALLRENHAAHDTLARQLLKQETVSGNDVKRALETSPGPESPADAAQMQRRTP